MACVAPLVGAWVEICDLRSIVLFEVVAPLVGAWVEIKPLTGYYYLVCVAPLVGAWVEMLLHTGNLMHVKSLPLWERGLKYIIGSAGHDVGPGRSPCGSVG